MGKVPPVDPVAQTSRWMAAARARESEHPYRLFDDPLATALVGPEGFAWLERMEPVEELCGKIGGVSPSVERGVRLVTASADVTEKNPSGQFGE